MAEFSEVRKRSPASSEQKIPSKDSFPAHVSLPKRIVSWAWNTVPYDSLPKWLRDNEFLHKSHRPPMYSFRGCMKSVFRMHTETMNIWSHLIGFLFFMAITVSVYCFQDYFAHLFEDDVTISHLPWQEQLVMNCFFAGAMICLFCSFTFHMFCNHSEKMYFVFSRLDYTGIAILIAGSYIPAFYYSFYCNSLSRVLHTSFIAVLGLGCVVLSFWSKFSLPKFRAVRFAVFVLFGLYGFVPGIQIAIQVGVTNRNAQDVFGLLLMAAIYILGAVLYVLRIPERIVPGWFDVWASSHQLFHVCVVAAALVHYNTLLGMIRTRLDLGECGGLLDVLAA